MIQVPEEEEEEAEPLECDQLMLLCREFIYCNMVVPKNWKCEQETEEQATNFYVR